MTFFTKNSIYFEILMILGFLAAIILGHSWAIYLTLGLLAAIYFLVAVNLSKTTEGNFVFGIIRITGVSCAIAVCGILFRLVEWPGSDILLIIGMTALILSVFLAVISILKNSENAVFLRMPIIKAMIYVGLIAVLLLFPQISALPSPVS
jgi:hypothetical protein